MVVHHLPLPRKAPELDEASVRAVAGRFAMHHRQRYLDALGKLDGRKREILAALPMFFHCNHPLLPGYQRDAPAGIRGHTPTGSDVAAIHRFARSFDASLRPSRQDIDAIFLMGSGGSLGHTADSDIDLWVCCAVALHDALLPKLRSIEHWALAQGLAVQGFLVDPAFFHDPEDSVHGPLLLDEFYRSGIHLTGREPLWWYVSGTTTTEYTQSTADLYATRLVTRESVLDFGPVGQPDLTTLCQAGMAELERALETPHKSLLKLALVESYLNHPERPLLSSHYHQLLRDGVNDVTRLDTYYMLYHFLDATPSHRLTTFSVDELRQLFVRKIVSRGREIARGSQLASEIRSWGFNEETLQRLRHPARMPLAAVLSEVSLVGELLNKGARFGRRLAMLAPSTRPALIEIENTLQRFAEPTDSMLRPMNRALLPDVHPGLEVRRVRQQWRLVEEGHVLRSADSWAELLLWLTINAIQPRAVHMPTAWFDQAAQFWMDSTSKPFDLLLFFNALPDPGDDGDRVITAFDDPLSYSGFFVCKARMVWCVQSSQDQLSFQSLHGESGVLDALLLACSCQGEIRIGGAAYEDSMLVQRIRNLLDDARTKVREAQPFEVSIGRSRYRISSSPDGKPEATLITFPERIRNHG